MSDLPWLMHVMSRKGDMHDRIIISWMWFTLWACGRMIMVTKWTDRQLWFRRRCRPSLLWGIGLFVLQLSCGEFEPSSVVITAEEFRFTPTLIEWPPSQPLRLLIRNEGRERHVFHSPELLGSEAAIIWHQPKATLHEAHAVVLEPGQSIELYISLSPGLYPFRCWIKGHVGMEGTILVKDST